MSEQVSADGMSDDQALNPPGHVPGSGQDLEVQQHTHVLGGADIENDDLESIVLSWSVSSISKGLMVSIMNEKGDLSPSNYLKGFKTPLIEETRAKILGSLESVSQLPYYELSNVLPTLSQNQSYLDIGISYGDHIPRNGDLFLLSNQESNELEKSDDSGVFALATNIGHYYRCIRGFDAKSTRSINSSKHKFAVFVCNLDENMRIWDALHMKIEDRAVMKLISSPSLIPKENCEICAAQMKTTSDLFSDLNEEQMHLAARMLSNANCDHTQSVNVAWGFAGTGKTKTISVVLAALLQDKVRTVICASNTLHCSTLVSYLCELIKGSEPCYGLDSSVGNILLLCDMEAVKNNAIKKFCLEWKINEIVPCMLWRSKMQNLISFLEKGFRELYKGGTKGSLTVLDLLKELFGRKSKTLVKLYAALLLLAGT